MRQQFKGMDLDGSGSIDLDEFLENQDQTHMSDHMASMFHAMDQDGDGNVRIFFVPDWWWFCVCFFF